MKSKIMVLDITDILKQFQIETQSMRTHSYEINKLIPLIASTFKLNNEHEVHRMNHYSFHVGQLSEDPIHDMQIMASAIVNMRNDFFDLLVRYDYIDKTNPDNPFKKIFTFHKFNEPFLYLDVS